MSLFTFLNIVFSSIATLIILEAAVYFISKIVDK